MENMLHKSFRDVFVVNNPALLTSGSTDNLAVNQLGIFSIRKGYNPTATATPNYTVDRAIQFFQGTPEIPVTLLSAVANASDRSKPIKGKNITGWQGRKAERGRTQKIALGFDGVDTTKTISALCEQSKTLFIKLTGGPIDQIFHAEGKGHVTQFSLFSGCCDDCGDDCTAISAEKMVDDLVKQVTSYHSYTLGGGNPSNKLFTARKITEATAPTPDDHCIEYLLSICDNGDDVALGLVQSAYSTKKIVRKDRVGSNSIYQLIQDDGDSAPADFSNAGLTTVSDCPACPSGYTSVASGSYVYKVERQDAGSSGNLTTLKSDYGITGSEIGNRIIYEYGQSTYIITSITAISAPVSVDNLQFLGTARQMCVLTTPTTTAWTVGRTLNRFAKVYRLTITDNVCGTSRLTELQAAFPDLVVTQTSGGVSGCVHRYQTTVLSPCAVAGCENDAPVFVAPDDFEGSKWEEVATSYTPGLALGVIFETSYVDRIVDENAFDFWNYDKEPLEIQISQHSQDYNDKPTVCTTEWPVTEIQSVKIPIGAGSEVREAEAFFKGYDRKYRDSNPIVREFQDSVLQTDPKKYYDQYTLSFGFDYHEHWFSEKFTDNYRLEFYFPEGQGKNFEAAINAYVSSLAIDLDPVVL